MPSKKNNNNKKWRVPGPGEEEIFTKFITRNGKRIYAWQYGLEAFRIIVKKK